MGNQSTKPNDEDNLNTARCPQRNRNIKSMHTSIERKKTSNQADKQQKNNHQKQLQADRIRSLEYEKKLTAQFFDLNTKEAKGSKKETNAKTRKKKRTQKGHMEAVPTKETETQNLCEENIRPLNAARKPLTCKAEKRYRSKAPDEHGANIISDIFNTVAELESTFLDEKKYDRRLRTAFSKQIESMQHLELSLHIEKERNKRLMELMNRYDNLEACNFKNFKENTEIEERTCNNIRQKLKEIELNKCATYKHERSQWQGFSHMSDAPISSMLVQQRYDDLCKSYAICQNELKQKDKLLTLAHCKQETLQAKCDRLTEQLLTSQRKIQSLQRKNTLIRKRIVQHHSMEFFENSMKNREDIAEESCESSQSLSELEDFNDRSTENDANLLKKMETSMFVEEEKMLPKTKAE